MTLAALVVAAVATVGVHLWLDVLPQLQTQQRAVTQVAEGESVETAGQTLALRGTRWDEFEAPKGMRTLSVRLDASGGADATWCGAFTLSEVNGDRVWLDARSVVDVPYDAGESSCRDESIAYEILAVFVVPADATGPFHLDVPGDAAEVTRFTIDE